MAQTIFKRYEKKYILNTLQYNELMRRLSGKMRPDKYGSYTINNIYYDTDQFDLIRNSLEKPLYKEKLRLRSYGSGRENNPIFLELKKKYEGVVYKRRAVLTYEESQRMLKEKRCHYSDSQVLNEIGYFLNIYSVEEKVYISYDRTALAGLEDENFRMTFDTNVKFRLSDLDFDKGNWGTSILEPGKILMEVKVQSAFPFWITRIFSDLQIFPSSFSKYGTCYSKYILGVVPEEHQGGIVSA